MHWSDEIAAKIIARRPDKDEYVCAAGISPSGSVHIGNFRDVATSFFVVKALERAGKKARLLFSWDEFDRLRKVPKNVEAVRDDYAQYIGYPYVDVPDPFDENHGSYAEHFEEEFERSMEAFGIPMDYRHQAQMYRSGAYRDQILLALQKRGEIFDILDSFRTQDAQEGEREAYYPVSIYCPHCHRDTTKIRSLSEDGTVAHFTCACGHEGDFDFKKDTNCKLAWKVDWPMRWAYEGVDFEPGGKDHASPGGSYDNGRAVAEKIFGYEAPLFQGYEFIGIKGVAGKMSGSSGLNLTPDTILKLYEPEVVLWLYSRSEPTKAFDFCFDDGILRQYFEFDKQYTQYCEGKADEFNCSVMDNCLTHGRTIKTVPMGLLVQLGSIVNFNPPMIETVFKKIGMDYTCEDFADRLDRARFWLEECAPEQANHLRAFRDLPLIAEMAEEEKTEIRKLHDYIAEGGYTLDDLSTKLYDIPKEVFGADAPNLKQLQGRFFQLVYRLLLAKERGPRLYLFLHAMDSTDILPLLDLDAEPTEQELHPELFEKKDEPVKKERVYGPADPVAPFKEIIEKPDFEKMDLRVAKIVKCNEIRKARNNLKLTVFDGIKERTIVSSIKDEYEPEELIGKKIIILANLAPARLTGVESEGMLLAATNSACGCQVIFVDDMVPEGTPVL
ncbi:MAG: lysine--tRNA ligase [Lachnospiraceae bacterium]|nr:lysine--tRNA ligase [Lachnospiraceae bacterium]